MRKSFRKMATAKRIIRAQAGFQERFVRSNVDFVVGGGSVGGGKSFGAVLCVAEPSEDGRFRGLFLRNNLGDTKAAGGIIDTFKDVYGDGCTIVESGEPHVDFPSGARIDVTHVSEQARDKILQRFKGRQYDFIYFDEGTGFTWECFSAIYTRNRGRARWTGKVRMTTNPDRNHWLRKWLDWYIGPDGFIIPERDGVVRYFFINGERVDDVVWGGSKEEVYHKARVAIDRILYRLNGENGTATYRDVVKSFCFYLGRMSENRAMLQNNDGYVGSVAVMGGRNAQQLLEGNWNVSPEDELDAPITMDLADAVFLADPQVNGDKWITCDLADTGTDNYIAMFWDGFHLLDIDIMTQSTPRMNAEHLATFAAAHGVPDSHIIYDAVRGRYINDYIPDAIPFISGHATVGLYARTANKLKDECYMRLVNAIKRRNFSICEDVANRLYEHQNFKTPITIRQEFSEECLVVRFRDMPSGRKALFSKKEMNAMLGRNRSMDLLDPCAMRMYPVLKYPYGEELDCTINEDEAAYAYGDSNNSIYDETLWQ